MTKYKVTDGDCADSVAAAHGQTTKKVWMHARNDELRKERGSPHLLEPGDTLFVPDLERQDESCDTEKSHRFRRKSVPARLVLVLKRNGKPVASRKVKIEVDGLSEEGELDDQGKLDVVVPPQAKEAILEVEGWTDKLKLALGGLDPIESVSGIQARLDNLGYCPGPIDGINGPLTKAAVKRFQSDVGAAVDGIVGPETTRHLEKKYGC
jgi:N-acetylmuramoyl-L-alanine amidase